VSARAIVLCAALLGCGAGWEPIDETASGLASDCPDKRHLKVFDGPASWVHEYGTAGFCVGSHYDCRMPTTDPDFRRYVNAADADGRWPVAPGIPIVDGRGNPIGAVAAQATKINFGQRKTLNGKEYVYAFAVDTSPTTKRSGWIPAGCVGWDGKTTPSASCTSGSGKTPSDFPVVEGRKPKSSKMVKSKFATRDEILAAHPEFAGLDPLNIKITCNTKPDLDASIADYLPRLSDDGTFYMLNLTANVPGLHPPTGGIAADTFRVAHLENGQFVSDQITFHAMIDVQELKVYLFAPGSTVGAPVEHASATFVYGYVTYPRGDGSWARRYGWVPFFALKKA